MRLTDFKVLTFDCYGTLIDWETGLYEALQPLLRKGKITLEREHLLAAFARLEAVQEAETPKWIYSDLLAEVHRRLAREWGIAVSTQEHVKFGKSVPDWPAFPDTAAALQYLRRYYKLVILSNVDRHSFAGTNAKLGVSFDAVYTAQDIGSYKPSPGNFEALTAEVRRERLVFHLILNAYWEPLDFELPVTNGRLAWRRWIDTALDPPNDIVEWQAAPPIAGQTYQAGPRSVAVLIAR